jgi:hypothetical protein
VVRSIHRKGTRGARRPSSVRATSHSLSAAQRVALIGLACRPPVAQGVSITHWSAAELRDHFNALIAPLETSVATIGRILAAAQLKPHRQRYWLTSTDPLYDQKLRDVVTLYLEPPPGATVLSLDEKPSIQALSRKHPDLPMRAGYPVAREFEYKRHGVMHLFAAFNVRTGFVDAQVREKKTRWEFIDLLETLAWRYRQGDVHCILDNASYHSTPEVLAWIAGHPRFQFHYTPTHASWLNQIECWFSILSRKVLRRGDFTSKKDLSDALLDYVDYWNTQAHPFNWAYGEDLIHAHKIAA